MHAAGCRSARLGCSVGDIWLLPLSSCILLGLLWPGLSLLLLLGLRLLLLGLLLLCLLHLVHLLLLELLLLHVRMLSLRLLDVLLLGLLLLRLLLLKLLGLLRLLHPSGLNLIHKHPGELDNLLLRTDILWAVRGVAVRLGPETLQPNAVLVLLVLGEGR